jgi:hypothetical protein
MPRPESAASFAKLLAARARLNEITKQLNDLRADPAANTQVQRARRAQLQMQWDFAFQSFDAATKEFSATVTRPHADIESRKSSLDSD